MSEQTEGHNGSSVGPGSPMPLRSALRGEDEAPSPKTGPQKVVSIAEPDAISPLLQAEESSYGSSRKKQHTASLNKRMTGRGLPPTLSNTSRLSLVSQSSLDELLPSPTDVSDSTNSFQSHSHHKHHHERLVQQIAEWLQAEKAKHATRRSGKKQQHSGGSAVADEQDSGYVGGVEGNSTAGGGGSHSRSRHDSFSSESSQALEKLQHILEESMGSLTSGGMHHRGSSSGGVASGASQDQASGHRHIRPSHLLSSRRRRSSLKSYNARTASSDTDFFDGDVVVPSCDVVLDNSKTMGYAGGGAGASATDLHSSSRRSEKDRKAWSTFKYEILRLAHTLRLKGWRRVPLNRGDDIEVGRLSGALTNAVYVVTPPRDLPAPAPGSTARRLPRKLLLRIYGPQVEHLIDRDSELSILRRLARKKIGPRLLGTFRNGRFEEFFDATTLTSRDLRLAETSRLIAKRMRELHDGVELEPAEREAGAGVWLNWEKWVERCGKVVMWADARVERARDEGMWSSDDGRNGDRNDDYVDDDDDDDDGAVVGLPRLKKSEQWLERGFVCGVRWQDFRKAIEKYRAWLEKICGGSEAMRQSLVFSHNDTQYGNILRLRPTSESPLLLPANEHKQLVVIDFEYASANPRGLEFANHFTEWCYNYHDELAAFVCNTSRYPTADEQRRFLRAYVEHRPRHAPAVLPAPLSSSSRRGSTDSSSSTATTGLGTPMLGPASVSGGGGGGGAEPPPYFGPLSTPKLAPQASGTAGLGPSSSVSSFMLDARAAPPPPAAAGETIDLGRRWREEERAVDDEVERILWETRLWRVANSAQWVAWGIVQAKLPQMEREFVAAATAAAAAAAAAAARRDDEQDGTGTETEVGGGSGERTPLAGGAPVMTTATERGEAEKDKKTAKKTKKKKKKKNGGQSNGEKEGYFSGHHHLRNLVHRNGEEKTKEKTTEKDDGGGATKREKKKGRRHRLRHRTDKRPEGLVAEALRSGELAEGAAGERQIEALGRAENDDDDEEEEEEEEEGTEEGDEDEDGDEEEEEEEEEEESDNDGAKEKGSHGGADAAAATVSAAATAAAAATSDEADGDGDDDDAFDYLAYAQERAMFVWGDLVALGIVKAEELPAEVRARMKVVGS